MKFNRVLLLLVAVASFFSCTKKENPDIISAQDDATEWFEMDSFHTIMSEAFHPYHDSVNLEPVKRLAEEMALEAEGWAATSLPQKINNDEMKALLNQLKTDTRSLATMIKGGASDDEIGTSLEALHNSFHTIMEAWNAEESLHQQR
jgi:hypothetical protein